LGVVLNFAKFRAFLASEAEGFGGEVWLGYRYTRHSQAKGEQRYNLNSYPTVK
jgi:hypothetical protein